MLVLSRKQQQTFLIGDQIEVKILKIRGNTVRIGISAPNDVKIMRGEISPFGLEGEIEVTMDAENQSSLPPLASRMKPQPNSDRSNTRLGGNAMIINDAMAKDNERPNSIAVARAS